MATEAEIRFLEEIGLVARRPVEAEARGEEAPEDEDVWEDEPSGEADPQAKEAEERGTEASAGQAVAGGAPAQARSADAEVRERRPVGPRNLFTHPDAHPVVLDMALVKAFGVEWFTWLPDTVLHEVELTFKTSVAEVNRLKILSVMALHLTDEFWREWNVFEKGIHALLGTPSRLDLVHPPRLDELYPGVSMANQIRKETFSDEVARYVAAVHLHEEVECALPPCDFASLYLSDPTYHCQDCGNKGSALPPFAGYCDRCSGRFAQDKKFSLAPAKPGAGKRVEILVTHDPEPVRKRYQELSASPGPVALRETSVDLQANKLLYAKEVEALYEARLQEQLAALKEIL